MASASGTTSHSAGEFYRGGVRPGSADAGGADHGTGCRGWPARPTNRTAIAKDERCSTWRKNQQGGSSSKIKSCFERNRHFLFIGLQNGADGGDGAAARQMAVPAVIRNEELPRTSVCESAEAKPASRAKEIPTKRYINEIRCVGLPELRGGDSFRIPAPRRSIAGECKRCLAAFADGGCAEADIEKELRRLARWGRRKQSEKEKVSARMKMIFRKSGYRPQKEYQAGSRIGQQEREKESPGGGVKLHL